MNSIVLIYFLNLLVFNACDEWNLVFYDNFDSNELDLDKWEIENQAQNFTEYETCNRTFDPDRISSIKDRVNSQNLTLINGINGTLGITAMKKIYNGKQYNSGWIKTKKEFKYGKFEIKAALPKGSSDPWGLYNSMIKLITPQMNKTKSEVSEITILNYVGVKFILNQAMHTKRRYFIYTAGYLGEGTILTDFNTYTIEWTNSYISFMINSIETSNISNINCEDFQFNKPLKLFLSIKVNNLEETLNTQKLGKWQDCPLFIIDYVKIYQKNSHLEAQTEDGKCAVSYSTSLAINLCVFKVICFVYWFYIL